MADRPTADMPPAALLGGGVIAVAVARSLGRAGIPVYAAGEREYDTVRYSRYCTRFVDLGKGAGVQDRWFDWLGTLPEGMVVMACHDDAVELVATRRSKLAALGHVLPGLNDDVALAMLDKARTYALAEAAGIPVPKTVTLAGPDDVDRIASLEFPIGLKPLHSHRFARTFGVRKKLFVVYDERAFAETYRQLAPLGLEFLATELVRGGDDRLASAWIYVDDTGEALFRFTNRKIRQHPPRFGIGCYRVAEPLPEVAELASRFARAIGLRGLASVEFKRDERDDAWKLIECNQRFTTATALVVAAGLDAPLFVYDRQLGRPQQPTPPAFKRVTLWYPVEDLRTALTYRREGRLTARSWARSVLRRQHFPLYAVGDPGPAVASWWRTARRGLRRFVGGARRDA